DPATSWFLPQWACLAREYHEREEGFAPESSTSWLAYRAAPLAGVPSPLSHRPRSLCILVHPSARVSRTSCRAGALPESRAAPPRLSSCARLPGQCPAET